MLQTQATGSKGFRKGFTKDCRSEFSASADSKGFSANTNGKGISVDAGGSAGDEENNDDKAKVMYVFKCKFNIEIIAIEPPIDSAGLTHALGCRLLSDGNSVLYALDVMMSTVVHGPPPDGCSWNDLPNSSFPCVLQCKKLYIEIIRIKPPVDSADVTHALGRRLLPDGSRMLYELVVRKSTIVHGHPPNGCTWDDLPNNSFP